MAISRRTLFGKLNLTLFRAMESATAFAKLRGNPYVELVHWLHQIWQLPDSDLQRVCRHFQIDPSKMESDFSKALSSLPAGASALVDFSHHIQMTVERSWIVASLSYNHSSVRGAWLIAALVQTPELRRVLLGISMQFQKISPDSLDGMPSTVFAGSSESNEGAHDGSGLESVTPGISSAAIAEYEDSKSVLARYCSDMTARARSGEIDPVIGRENEIRTMIDILLRRRQNNPLLTGEAGVGKTAVVEGLAVAIATGDVPPPLKDVRLLSLDVGALLAGASMRGEFESRLKAVLEEAGKSSSPVIMFVDEVHTLVGAGGQAGTGDAANLLKPALARGSLRTIGATTWSEYKRHIEKDPALTRRFQVLQVMEPQEASAVEMVRGLVDTFKKHHGVTVLDEAAVAAVKLSHRYIPARQLPDKAISLLDTACARVAMSLHAPPAQVIYLRQRLQAMNTELGLLQTEREIGQQRAERLHELQNEIEQTQQDLARKEVEWQSELVLVQRIYELRQSLTVDENNDATSENRFADQTRDQLKKLEDDLRQCQGDAPLICPQVDASVVASIVSDWTGIPVGRMVQNEVAAVLGLQAQLEKRVIGQARALAVVCERIEASRARLTDPEKPVGTFLLVGPSGVGKTETALALAEALYGGEQNLITINMSEYQEAHTISALKGAPPGYVGYGEGGVLTEAVRRRPYSVILLDEVEKAHPDVHELFYQVFDKGWMEDGEGRVIDFRNTLILLTSNTGSHTISQLCEDPALIPDEPALTEALQLELRKVFPTAFIGRLCIVPYLPLAQNVLGNIVRLQLQRVAMRFQDQHGIALECGDAVVSHIARRCGAHETGARLLAGFIERHVLPPLARIWLDAMSNNDFMQGVAIEVADAAESAAPGGLSFKRKSPELGGSVRA